MNPGASAPVPMCMLRVTRASATDQSPRRRPNVVNPPARPGNGIRRMFAVSNWVPFHSPGMRTLTRVLGGNTL